MNPLENLLSPLQMLAWLLPLPSLLAAMCLFIFMFSPLQFLLLLLWAFSNLGSFNLLPCLCHLTLLKLSGENCESTKAAVLEAETRSTIFFSSFFFLKHVELASVPLTQDDFTFWLFYVLKYSLKRNMHKGAGKLHRH